MLPTSHELLAGAIDELETSAATGVFRTMDARFAAEASLVLGFSELAARASQILTRAPAQNFFAGAIMNFVPDADAIARLRKVHDIEAVEPNYPRFSKSVIEPIAESQIETSLAWHRRYDEALAHARKHPRQPPETCMVAEIAVTAAVLGDFATAEKLLGDKALRPGEVHAVRLTLAIEYVRYQRPLDAERVFASIEPVKGWARIVLALGFAGRMPWQIYPYADW